MKKYFGALFLAVMIFAQQAEAADQPIFGPVKYDVKERFGKDNLYSETFKAAEGLYLIKIQVGEKSEERAEWIEFSLNGEKLLKDDKYEYRFLACIVKLQSENKFELLLKDNKPSGFKRPAPTPRNVIITVIPAPVKISKVIFGLNFWESLKEFTESIQKIKDPAAVSLAIQIASLQSAVPFRVEGIRQLGELKDMNAQDFIRRTYEDYADKPEVRGEAAIALGMLADKKDVPTLMNGVLDAEEAIRIGSAKGLSYYKEADTKEQLTKMLEKLDEMRKTAVIKAIVSAGWRPVGTLIILAEGTDPNAADLSIKLLGGSKDPRVGDVLLKFLDKPGPRNLNYIIGALGECREERALEPLLKIAQDPVQRKGKEVELGQALAAFGDQRAVDVITDMIKKAERRSVRDNLHESYKKLTGRNYSNR